jgi:phosphoribosylaminoimidazolecarboxamide formyltransferase / IMP cyclohydrolase
LKSIQTALISVFYKDGLEPVLAFLHQHGVQFISTGGTQSFIESLGYPVTPVEDLTSYPSILGGRVKTLHPKVFGGILGRRNHEQDQAEMAQYGIPEIDLIIVDLYPFEETVAQTSDEATIIEKIDIGGISLIRAAAKNFADTLIVSDRSQYSMLLEALNAGEGATSLETRKAFARQAFAMSSHYDTAIYSYFAGEDNMAVFKQSELRSKTLRYGENPHQKGVFFGDLDGLFDKLNGKELSYNNLVDIDAGIHLIGEFRNEAPTFAILKHTNPCGVATRPTLSEAWDAALAADPVSAFGGVLVCNSTVDAATAEKMNTLFFEVLVAPAYDEAALEILRTKKNRILLQQKIFKFPELQFKSLLNGVIAQDFDHKIEVEGELKTVTAVAPSAGEVQDLLFANKLVKHLKSNTIVLARDGQMLSMGCGQTSRVDALQQAIHKAKSFGFDLTGAVMASDAFFPFPDCVEIAHLAGITAVIQPGGSIKDKDSIDYCDANGLSMVFTGVRHFKH